MADQEDPKAEQLGKQLAEQMQDKLNADEAHSLAVEDDDIYDARVITVLETKLKAAVTGFNDVAKAADRLSAEKGTSMVQMFKANLPVFAAKVQHRQVLILPATQSTPVQTYAVAGGPDEFTFSGKSQTDFLKELLSMATSGGTGLK